MEKDELRAELARVTEQVAFLAQDRERLTTECTALRMLVSALIAAHPDRASLRAAFETEKELFVGHAHAKPISDAEAFGPPDIAERILRLAPARRRG